MILFDLPMQANLYKTLNLFSIKILFIDISTILISLISYWGIIILILLKNLAL